MLEKEISKIFKNNSISFEEMMFDYETFEEPPLVNFFPEVIKYFEKHICQEDFNIILFNLAFCHLNNIKLYAKKYLSSQELNDFFICLTSTTDQELVNEFGFFMPSFFITRKKILMKSLKTTPQVNFDEYPCFRGLLNKLGLEESVVVLHKKWFDNACNEELDRFYFIYKEDFERL